ncbi:MAG: 2-phosphosulfolactate phosphatase [Chloroflexi bacterium]|nr:2-phosphosulfolactate phosphatase [Chloroflexota bacterium]
MIVDVAWLPGVLGDPAGRVIVMVDVLRASTTLAVMLERGAAGIELVEEVDEARERARQVQGALLCGERGGLPPVGFDYGNSPSEFAALDLAGRRLVLCTSNGTRAMRRVAAAPVVLVGSLRNAGAAVDAAMRCALAGGWDLTILCAGRALGTAFGLDDACCAGYLIERLLAHPALPAPDAAADPAQLISGGSFRPSGLFLDESAIAALRLCRSYTGDLEAALRESGNGQGLLRLKLDRDVVFCARVDESAAVPRLVVAPDERLSVIAHSQLE